MQRITNNMKPVVLGYGNFVGVITARPAHDTPARLAAVAEVTALLLAFSMHAGAAHADVFTDAYITNPGKVSREQLTRGAGLAHGMVIDTVHSAADFISSRDWPQQRRGVLESLDTSMTRMARTLPQAKRREVQALLTGAAEKVDAEQQAMIARILEKLRDAPCNKLCEGS